MFQAEFKVAAAPSGEKGAPDNRATRPYFRRSGATPPKVCPVWQPVQKW